MPHGYGKKTFNDGSMYEGDMVSGRLEGYGTHVKLDGNTYQGQFKDNKFDGHGKVTYPTGNVEKGEFSKGMRIGVHIFKNHETMRSFRITYGEQDKVIKKEEIL
jgi:hypothetical protein